MQFIVSDVYKHNACYLSHALIFYVQCSSKWINPLYWKFTNRNIIMCSFKSSGNFQRKEVGPGRSVFDDQSSSVTLDEQAMKARKIIRI